MHHKSPELCPAFALASAVGRTAAARELPHISKMKIKPRIG
ncbi:hypothetical protein [Methanimicrococcus stummii]|nr:hypothetical protein [Methanimicrococcus sp. Es2]